MSDPVDAGESGVVWEDLAVRDVRVPTTVAARIQRLIQTGRLTEGERLPAERELAAALNVSRASIREALHELTLKGLLDRRPGRGTIVRSGAVQTGARQMLAHLDDGEREMVAVLDFRAAIEPAIAARAATRATPADLEQLRDVLEAMRVASSPEEAAELDARFHHLIASATHNVLFEHLLEHSSQWLQASREESLNSIDGLATSLHGHEVVLEAIESGDPAAAHEAMAAHVDEVTDLIVQSTDLET